MNKKALRIGQIRYSNTLPVYLFFDEKKFERQIDFSRQVPAQLNAAMAKGEIDVGPISAFSYAEHEEKYLVLPDLSVSAYRQVRSIYLFSKRPIEQLDGAKVALTNTSATSVNLLKVILQMFMGYSVSYQTQDPSLPRMMETADAALLIGDDAVFSFRTYKQYYAYDLAELWHRHTGYSMTFALWTVRKAVIDEHQSLLRDVYASFLESKYLSLRHLSRLVDHAVLQYGGEAAFWYEYFRGLSYDFSPQHRQGLEYYYACTAKLGLLPRPVRVSLWENAATHIQTTG